jgi:Tfp pilus assembly protein FimT
MTVPDPTVSAVPASNGVRLLELWLVLVVVVLVAAIATAALTGRRRP